MPYVHVDIDLEDFDDSDLIEELKERGYKVGEETLANDLEDVIWHFKGGRPKEALIALERIERELYGISDYIKD